MSCPASPVHEKTMKACGGCVDTVTTIQFDGPLLCLKCFRLLRIAFFDQREGNVFSHYKEK